MPLAVQKIAARFSLSTTSSNRVAAIERIQRGLADVKAGRKKPARQVPIDSTHGIRR